MAIRADHWCCPPLAHHRLLDTVRRSIVTPDLEIQDQFLDAILSLDEFDGIRVKSTMPDPTAQVKQTIINIGFTPKTSGFRPRLMIFSDITKDPKIQAYARELAKANCKTLGVTAADVNAALELFEAPGVASRSVSMIIELQLYTDHFHEARKICHIWWVSA